MAPRMAEALSALTRRPLVGQKSNASEAAKADNDTRMTTVLIVCAVLVISTTVVHYEVLRALNFGLPLVAIPNRRKLLIVVIATFFAHAVEMAIYGIAVFAMVRFLDIGALAGKSGAALSTSLYFSAETYTSLGFGDIRPIGPVRVLAGVEALNGLLLIGWSASFIYLAMERFWRINK